jgi:hypothetical protein
MQWQWKVGSVRCSTIPVEVKVKAMVLIELVNCGMMQLEQMKMDIEMEFGVR